jgi:L-asparaginase II
VIESIIVRLKNGMVIESAVETGEQHVVVSDKDGKTLVSLPVKEAEKLSRAINHVIDGIYITEGYHD